MSKAFILAPISLDYIGRMLEPKLTAGPGFLFALTTSMGIS